MAFFGLQLLSKANQQLSPLSLLSSSNNWNLPIDIDSIPNQSNLLEWRANMMNDLGQLVANYRESKNSPEILENYLSNNEKSKRWLSTIPVDSLGLRPVFYLREHLIRTLMCELDMESKHCEAACEAIQKAILTYNEFTENYKGKTINILQANNTHFVLNRETLDAFAQSPRTDAIGCNGYQDETPYPYLVNYDEVSSVLQNLEFLKSREPIILNLTNVKGTATYQELLSLYEMDHSLTDGQKKVLFSSLKAHNASNLLAQHLDEGGEKQLRDIAMTEEVSSDYFRLLNPAAMNLQLMLSSYGHVMGLDHPNVKIKSIRPYPAGEKSD